MSTQVVDLVRDSTMQKMQAELVAVHKASVLASGSTAAIDQICANKPQTIRSSRLRVPMA